MVWGVCLRHIVSGASLKDWFSSIQKVPSWCMTWYYWIVPIWCHAMVIFDVKVEGIIYVCTYFHQVNLVSLIPVHRLILSYSRRFTIFNNVFKLRGSLNKFQDFFFLGALLLIVHTWNSSPLWSNLLWLQFTCSTVPTTYGRLHGSPLVWACQWLSSQPFSSPQLSYNDSLWA